MFLVSGSRLKGIDIGGALIPRMIDEYRFSVLPRPAPRAPPSSATPRNYESRRPTASLP
jgi:hypothetical protein